jgi:hypothetical protein
MVLLFFILLVCSIFALMILIARLLFKLDEVIPKFKTHEYLIVLSILMVFTFSFLLGTSISKSQTDTIKDYNKGLYQEKITYESIDGNIIPQDTVYIFKK